MLIIFGGLPGVGKTTISKALASELKAVYLRIDTVEQVLKDAAGLNGPEGVYGVLGASRRKSEPWDDRCC